MLRLKICGKQAFRRRPKRWSYDALVVREGLMGKHNSVWGFERDYLQSMGRFFLWALMGIRGENQNGERRERLKAATVA